MNDPDAKLDEPPLPTLEYARRLPWWRSDLTPEQQRRHALWLIGIVTAATLAYWFGMFWTCRPALTLFCFGPIVPLMLAVTWAVLGAELLKLNRSFPPRRRRTWHALAAVALSIAPYTFLRADNDMFALGVRFRIRQAGGADKVRAEFNQWVASRPPVSPVDQPFLFMDQAPGGRLVQIPQTRLPPSVQYIRQHIGCRFGFIRNGAAVLDNVAVPNTADVMIGPPGWTPAYAPSVLDHICGSHRKLADGIWIRVGKYNK
jgi:hypothetical protein